MKIIKTSFIVAFFALIHTYAFGQDKKFQKAEFKVEGVCEMCKKRIESSLDTKGIRYVNYNIESGILNVVFKPEDISLDSIHTRVAKAGHSTSLKKANNGAYEKLPECCKYQSVEKH